MDKNLKHFFLIPHLLSHDGPDEPHGLLQRVRRVAAGVQDERAQAQVRQQAGVAVDLVDGVQHRLHALKQKSGEIK